MLLSLHVTSTIDIVYFYNWYVHVYRELQTAFVQFTRIRWRFVHFLHAGCKLVAIELKLLRNVPQLTYPLMIQEVRVFDTLAFYVFMVYRCTHCKCDPCTHCVSNNNVVQLFENYDSSHHSKSV